MRPFSKQSPENPQPTFNVQRQTRGADHRPLITDQNPYRRAGNMTTPTSFNPHLEGFTVFRRRGGGWQLGALYSAGTVARAAEPTIGVISNFRDEHPHCRA
jgi:hypothetical protein